MQNVWNFLLLGIGLCCLLTRQPAVAQSLVLIDKTGTLDMASEAHEASTVGCPWALENDSLNFPVVVVPSLTDPTQQIQFIKTSAGGGPPLPYACDNTAEASTQLNVAPGIAGLPTASQGYQVRWQADSRTQYFLVDCIECPYTAKAENQSTASFTLELVLPVGQVYNVPFVFSNILTIHNEQSEAAAEDEAVAEATITLTTPYQTVTLHSDAIQSIGLGGGILSQQQVGVAGQRGVANGLKNGDQITVTVDLMTRAEINDPPEPGFPQYDNAQASVYGYISFGFDIEEDVCDEYPYFSVDLGSHQEVSNGIANLDPADVYSRTGVLAYEFDDADLEGGNDPWPMPNAPGSVAPLCQGGDLLDIAAQYLDIDAIDRLATDLEGMVPDSPAPGTLLPFFDGQGFIHFPTWVYVSYDEDTPGHYLAANCSIPVNSTAPFGNLGQADEIVGHYLDPSDALLDTAWSFSQQLPAAAYSEEWLSPLLFPAPTADMESNDDVDALDFMSDCSEDVPETWQYFSVDNEAVGTVGGQVLHPGVIYRTQAGGPPVGVIDPEVHLGIVDAPAVDIDAFEFTWLYSGFPHNQYGLALLFSVDADDPLTPVDESGGLSPSIVYASFLNGSHFVFMLQMQHLLTTDIDAIGIGLKAPRPDNSQVETPDEIITGVQNPEQRTKVDFTVFPNPARTYLTIAMAAPETTPVRLELYTSLGQRVYTYHWPQAARGGLSTTVPIPADLPAGTYTVRVDTEQGSMTKQVIVQQ